MKPWHDEPAGTPAAQRFRQSEHRKVRKRLNQHHQRVGAAESGDRCDVLRIEATTLERPERHPLHNAALIGCRERQRLRVAEIDVGRVRFDDAVGQRREADQGHEKRCDVHAVLREVVRSEEQALCQQTECETDCRRRYAEYQELCRGEDEVDLRYAHRKMRHHFKKRENEGRGKHRAPHEGAKSLFACSVPRQIHDKDTGSGGSGVAQ